MIAFNNVSVTFDGKKILSDFTLNIREGDKIIISGRSGIGKSTILRLALGFQKPDKGNIMYIGHVYTKDIIWQIRRESAYISQDMEIGGGSIDSYLDHIFSFRHGNVSGNYKDRLAELISEFELPQGLLGKQIEELSGGEKQRLMIVIALLLKRKIFFLDEITSALDAKLKQKIISFFLSQKEWTEVIVSHDPGWMEHGVITNIPLEDYYAGS